MPIANAQFDDPLDATRRGKRAIRPLQRIILDWLADRMSYLLFLALLSATITASGIRAAAAEPRLALVISNLTYPGAEPAPKDTREQGRSLADELRRNGFEVDTAENLTKEAMRTALEGFYGKIKPGSTALIFFSGFGLQCDRQGYLLPVSAQIWKEADIESDGIDLDRILQQMDGHGAKVKIAILDASRPYRPFEQLFRHAPSGLAPPIAPRETAVIFAAPPGLVVRSERQLFLPELRKQIARPIGIEEVFINTQAAVSRESRGEQVPWFSSSLSERVILAKAVTAGNGKPVDERAADTEQGDFEIAERTDTATAWKNFLGRHPRGSRVEVARERLARAQAPEIRDLDRQIGQKKDNLAAYQRRGQLLSENGAFKAAIKDFDEVIRLAPKDVDALNDRCWSRAIVGELQEALKDCNQAVALRPRSLHVYDSRGLVYLKSERPRDALADYDFVLNSYPKHVSSLYGRGIAKLRTGDAAGGKVDIAAARALQPDIAQQFAGYGVSDQGVLRTIFDRSAEAAIPARSR
ncbi:MAG: hypothetical protein C5B56_16190 [Proteobacteria bacterium]|nr:MAG: hypothetical protein C5B56_16190 [Pseudomonadota bacterium]